MGNEGKSPGTISNLNKKVYEKIEEWRSRPIEEDVPYVYLDGIRSEESWAGEVSNVSVLVAIGVNRGRVSPDPGDLRGSQRGQSGPGRTFCIT